MLMNPELFWDNEIRRENSRFPADFLDNFKKSIRVDINF